MAECSYSRCVQQKRNIRRELQRWTKTMVHIVGLERIAEELMGGRKWKLYQESMSRNYLQTLNNNVKPRTTSSLIESPSPGDQQHILLQQKQHILLLQQQQQQLQQQPDCRVPKDHHHHPSSGSEDSEPCENVGCGDRVRVVRRGAEGEEEGGGERALLDNKSGRTSPEDWKPQEKCFFCVDGKLDSEPNSQGVLSPHYSESDSSDSHASDSEAPPSLTPSPFNNNSNNHHHLSSNHHRRNRHHHNHHHHHQNLSPVSAVTTQTQTPTLPPNMTTTIENMALAVAAFTGQFKNGGSSPGTTAAPHLPFYPSILGQNWYLANVARTFQNERLAAVAAAAAAAEVEKANVSEQPLDLSSKSGGGGSVSGNTNSSNGGGDKLPVINNVRLPTPENKQHNIFKVKPRMPTVAGRRTYTEDELQAALRDIQSGKLGTRRAAVIYGIPRSTLRNKVYKLALERERESHLNNSTSSSSVLKIDEDETIEDEKELSGTEEEKEFEKALKSPILTLADVMRLNMDPEILKTLLQRSREGVVTDHYVDKPDMTSYLQNLILASQIPRETVLNHAEFVKRLIAEEHLLKMQKVNGDASERLLLSRPGTAEPLNTTTSNSSKLRTSSELDMDTESVESSSSATLKIPSYSSNKPIASKNGLETFFRQVEGSSNTSMVSPASESNSPPILPGKLSMKDVKDVIAQSINQKFQQIPVVEPSSVVRRPPQMMEMDFKSGSFTPPLTSGISVIKTNPQEASRSFQQQQQQQQQKQSSQNSSGQPSGGKGTRPKRGKYRNYDRDSLVEAVRAVQRGEMSVHRAGSYYGVPHSTLEYKVKERHLMRPRKRDPKPNPVDEKIASLKQNDLRNNVDKAKTTTSSMNVMKPPQKFPPTSPNGMKLPIFDAPMPGFNAPPFPFWPHPSFHHPIPLDYARNPSTSFPNATQEYFASQMMQKLQEETSRSTHQNAKSARQMAESLLEGGGSNFLDGIIRSSLESGVPGGEERIAVKEEKNLENMSNKTLLEQLCKNSQLSKFSSGGDNSSGDESYRKGNNSPLNFSATVKEEKMDDSPPPYADRDGADTGADRRSNDSPSEAKRPRSASPDESSRSTPAAAATSSPTPNISVKPPGRIYLKPELVNPDNLKPEMLVRCFVPDIDRNGLGGGVGAVSLIRNGPPPGHDGGENAGASDNDNDAHHQD